MVDGGIYFRGFEVFDYVGVLNYGFLLSLAPLLFFVNAEIIMNDSKSVNVLTATLDVHCLVSGQKMVLCFLRDHRKEKSVNCLVRGHKMVLCFQDHRNVLLVK